MRKTFGLLLAAIVVTGVPLMARADLITNGDFSAGFTGWTTFVQLGSSGNWFLTTGGQAPISGSTYEIPSNGTQYAVTDQGGPSHVALSQSFATSGGDVNIQYDLFAQNWNLTSYCDNGMNSLIPGIQVQCARVDVLDSANNVVDNLFLGANSGAFAHYNFNLNLVPGTYTLQFEEADNQFFFQMGVDNVSVNAVPEPASLALLGMGLIGLVSKLRRRRWD